MCLCTTSTYSTVSPLLDSTHPDTPTGNGLDASKVHNDLQSLSLNDKNTVGNGNIGYKPRVEEWVRETSQTALPLENMNDSSNLEPPRDISSPTFTDSSLNYSQMVSVYWVRFMLQVMGVVMFI